MSSDQDQTVPKRIAIYGGTFDPIHEGHVYIAEQAKRAMKLDHVIFLPCLTSPHRLDHQPASSADRLQMIRFAIESLPWATCSDYELNKTSVSYSYESAQYFRSLYPQAELFWLMGADQWLALPRWKHPEILSQLLEFIVMKRNDISVLPDHPVLSLVKAHLIEGDHPASASEIRQKLSHHLPVAWLSPKVQEWIMKQYLYQKK